MVDRDRTAVTYRCECWRALSAGVIEAAGTIFLLLIAVRYYKTGPLAKAMVAGGGSLGLILAPWVVLRVEASGWPVAKAAARLAALGAASFLVMALVPALPLYVAGCVLAMTTSSAAIPLLTQIYQENYPDRERGRRFARAMMIRIAVAPLRVEYLANPRYGVRWQGQLLTAGTVALLTGVIPNIARLILNPLWGWLFDHMNFFILRLTLNLGFALGILSFFVSGSAAGLVAGAVFFGISNAGADVAWGLWVTKFAPPDRVADYMVVHICFTGVRGVLAPLAAFYLVSGVPLNVLGWISVGLIAIGSAFLVPEIKFGKGARRRAVLVEEISE
jgi:hypothetical protein